MTADSLREVSVPQELARGIDAMGLLVTEAQQLQLLGYMDLIQKWNKVYNLTSLRDPAEMLSHHLIDSLTAVRPLQLHVQALAVRGACAHGCDLCDLADAGDDACKHRGRIFPLKRVVPGHAGQQAAAGRGGQHR